MSRTRASPRAARWSSKAASRRARPASGGWSTGAGSWSTTTPGTRRTGASQGSGPRGRARAPCPHGRKKTRRRRRRPPLPRQLPRRRPGRSFGLRDLVDDGSPFDLRNRFDKPNRYPGRLQRAGISAGVARPSLCDQLAVPLDAIVEAEARPANVAAARGDHQPVVEAGRRSKADVCVERQRFDALGLQRRVAAAKAGEVLDPRDLEPDEVDGVMRDALRVRLGKANLYLGREAEVHG